MSIKVLSWAFHDAPADLKPSEFVVLLALADAAADDGRVVYLGSDDKTQEAIARKARLSRRTVQRMLDTLVERALIERERSSILLPYEYRVVASDWRNGTRQGDATGGVRLTQRTYIDGIDGVEGSEKGSRKPRRKGPLPADWGPTEDHRTRSAEAGVDVEREAAKFRAHAEANGREAVVWNAAFTQWLLNARPSAPVPGAASAAESWGAGNEWMEYNR